MDIAALGLSVDSGPAERAVAALRQLGPASRGAAAGADQLAGSAEREARAMSSASSAANDNARMLRVSGSAAREAAAAYEQAASRLERSISAIARNTAGMGATDNYNNSLARTAYILDELRAKYNPLYAAGKQYATALADINQAARVGALTDGEHAKAVANLRSGYVSQISALRQNKAEVEANAKATGKLGFQAKQTLIQLPDVVQGIAGGQGVFRTAIQQGGQLVQIYGMGPGGVGGSLRQVGRELAAMITPMRLVGGGIAAIVIATTAAVLSWKNYATALDDLSHITGTATAELSRLQTAASIKGIGQDDFAGGMRRFADAVYDAKAGTNDLATLLRLNGKTVSDTAGTLDTVAELVRRAKDDQQRLQILQQAGLPATMEWVRLTRGGADGLRAAKEEATKFGGALNDEMVAKAREFDEVWNRAWTNFGISMRRTVIEGYDLLQRLIEQGREAVGAFDRATGGRGLSTVGSNLLKSGFGTPLSQDVGQLYGGLMAGPKGAGDAGGVRDAAWLAQQQRAIQLEQQRISLLGEAATAADHRREVELQLQAAQLAGVNLTEQQIEKIKRYAQEERSLAETQKTLSALGNAATESERYAARLQELNVALGRNTISQEQYNRAVAYAEPIFAGVANTLENNLTSGLASIVDGTKSAKDAFRDMSMAIINEINQMIIKLMIVRPLINGLAGGFGGMFGGNSPGAPSNYAGYNMTGVQIGHTGGIVGQLSAMRYVHPAYFENAPRFHSGGIAGDEVPIIARKGEGVFTPGQMAAMGGTTQVNVSVVNNTNSQVSVQKSQNSSGGADIQVLVEQIEDRIASNVAQGRGALNSSLRGRYGLQPAFR